MDSDHRSENATDLQSVPFGHSGTHPDIIVTKSRLNASSQHRVVFAVFHAKREIKLPLGQFEQNNANNECSRTLVCATSYCALGVRSQRRVVLSSREAAQANTIAVCENHLAKQGDFRILELVNGLEPLTC